MISTIYDRFHVGVAFMNRRKTHDKIQALKDLGYSSDDLKGIRLEIVDNLDKLAKSVEKDGLNSLVVELVNPEVHLGWRANNNGGGNWGGLKLVATDIKFIGA